MHTPHANAVQERGLVRVEPGRTIHPYAASGKVVCQRSARAVAGKQQ